MTDVSTMRPSQAFAPSCEVLERTLPRLAKVTVQASVRVGHRRMTVNDLCEMVPGTVLELTSTGISPAELMVHDLLLATGDIVRNGIQLGFRLQRMATATNDTPH